MRQKKVKVRLRLLKDTLGAMDELERPDPGVAERSERAPSPAGSATGSPGCLYTQPPPPPSQARAGGEGWPRPVVKTPAMS